MSWGQGFFRIWILLTVLYVAAVALFSYDGIAEPWVAERAFYYRATLEGMRTAYPEKYANLEGAALEDAVYQDFYADMTRQQFRAAIELAKRNVPAVIEQFSDEYRHFEKGVADGELQKIQLAGVPGVFMFARAGTSPEKIDGHMKDLGPKAQELRRQLVFEKRTEALWSAIGAALIPPALLLALGFAVKWVLAGFRQRSGTTT